MDIAISGGISPLNLGDDYGYPTQKTPLLTPHEPSNPSRESPWIRRLLVDFEDDPRYLLNIPKAGGGGGRCSENAGSEAT